MVKFVSTRSYLIPHTCTSTNFLHYILRTETSKSSSAKDQRIYHMLTKYLYAPWNYQINLLVSLWFLLRLFCCHLGRICDLYFRQKYWKSFYSCDNNILFGYDIIQGIQQATRISFFPFVGYQSGNRKKTHFALLGSRSEHRFPARSRVPPKHINSREIGKTCQQKWNFQHQNHDDHDFLITYENETSSTTRLIILVFLNALEHQSNSSRNLPR